MAANNLPIFPKTPNAGVMNVLLTSAMTNTKSYDGTEAAGAGKKELICTAGADGTRIDSILINFVSTNGSTASGTTAATLVRFFLNNGSSDVTATNNRLLGEIEIPATTLVALATQKNAVYSFPVNLAIPAGFKVYAGLTVAVGGTNCAIQPSVIAGDY